MTTNAAQPVAICPRCGTPQPVVWVAWDDEHQRIERHNRRDLERGRWAMGGVWRVVGGREGGRE